MTPDQTTRDRQVYVARAPRPTYAPVETQGAPELREPAADVATVTLRRLLQIAGFDRAQFGGSDWNPLGELIRPGERVLLKPNWVLHENYSGAGLDCMVTHTSVIAAILRYVALARPGEVVVGDAPVQGCDFDALRRDCRLDGLRSVMPSGSAPLEIRDFRRTILEGGGAAVARAGCRSLDHYVLFDLGTESMLEPISGDYRRFRVTMYDPDAMHRTHAPGRHQYLIAREVLDADVVVNIPKLKTHKKAGVTGALKNMVGINGHKEYLPHHRKGAATAGGDCYDRANLFKYWSEELLDQINRSRSRFVRHALMQATRAMKLGTRLTGGDSNVDGSWYGNDTTWRMVLDLQRILHYGRSDGTLAQDPQRRVLTITDAIVAGEGEGPLSPTPMDLGLMTLGTSTAAVEWVHALLMRLDPARLPLIREAFAGHDHPLAAVAPEAIEINAEGERLEPADLVARYSRPFRAPAGWAGRCEIGSEVALEN